MIGETHASPAALTRRRARGVLYPRLPRAHRERLFPPTFFGLVAWIVVVGAAGVGLSVLAADLVAELGPWCVPVVLLAFGGLVRGRWSR